MFKINSSNETDIRVREAIVDNTIKINGKLINKSRIESWDHMASGNGEYPEHIDVKTITVNDINIPDSDMNINESGITIHKPGSEAKYEADGITIDGKTINANKIQEWDNNLIHIPI
jgi:hypothetical protein